MLKCVNNGLVIDMHTKMNKQNSLTLGWSGGGVHIMLALYGVPFVTPQTTLSIQTHEVKSAATNVLSISKAAICSHLHWSTIKQLLVEHRIQVAMIQCCSTCIGTIVISNSLLTQSPAKKEHVLLNYACILFPGCAHI